MKTNAKVVSVATLACVVLFSAGCHKHYTIAPGPNTPVNPGSGPWGSPTGPIAKPPKDKLPPVGIYHPPGVYEMAKPDWSNPAGPVAKPPKGNLPPVWKIPPKTKPPTYTVKYPTNPKFFKYAQH